MRRANILKLLYLAGAPKVLRLYKRNHLTILCLHQISDEEDYFFNPIKPLYFEQLIKYILKYYTVISFSELAEIKKPLAKPALILSFDDGYYDFYEHALPILDKYKLASNHNIVNECANTNSVIWTQRLNYIFNHCRENNIKLDFGIDDLNAGEFGSDQHWMEYYLKVLKYLLQTPKPERIKLISEKERELSLAPKYKMMRWEEIVDCSKHKVEIGSHTYTHDILPTISDCETLEFELVKSKTEIEEHLKKPVNVIALPNGQGNKLIDDFIRQAGYKYLLYVNDGINKLPNIADNKLNTFERILLVNESPAEIILRTELFHSKIRKYV